MEAHSSQGGLTLKAYGGDGAVLLAFDVDDSLRADLAGFAVEYSAPGSPPRWIANRLTFNKPIVAATTPEERRAIWTPTSQAPLQKFHWVHFPSEVLAGNFTYTATAMLFKTGSETELQSGPQTSVQLDLAATHHKRFRLGFTRGYLSSQAYADRFNNAPIVPSPETIDFDTQPFEAQYEWLGFDARKLIFELLDETLADPGLSLDVLAYDLDEPDVIRRLQQLGSRVRVFLDDSDSHTKPNAHGELPLEADAKRLLSGSAGAANVKTGHFQRFAHNKVLIQRRGDTALKVLAGSANFSVRGLYVQSNNVFLFDDPGTAELYEQAFEQAWAHPLGEFDQSPIAAKWFERSGEGLPDFAVSFSPHTDESVSLARVADAIAQAQSSVLFAVMEIGNSSGPVVKQISELPTRSGLYAFGTTQKLDGALKVTTPADPNSPFIPFSYLSKQTPAPFRAEVAGGAGIVIHDKFVVCDFNGAHPVVFAGSSNLAGGGERENGDNLVAFSDRDVATAYAIEAIQMIDHYRFRAVQSKATQQTPLRLKQRSEDWTHDYFDPASPRQHERLLFVS
ncbi:MAG TPA: phospholipase D-like domain-containing protein [Solirubrobacteraceae bacterium]|nr:phospholipase D-like domain-containing protein [Solirubrobacteraceae bacterium]